MSIEIFVMSDRRLNSMAEWQRAIEQEGFDLRLDASRPFEALHGHLPAWRGTTLAGFECDHWDPVDLLDDDDLADIDFGRRWTQTLAFRIGGDFLALWAALAAATASYARATGGVVFEGEEAGPDARQGCRYDTLSSGIWKKRSDPPGSVLVGPSHSVRARVERRRGIHRVRRRTSASGELPASYRVDRKPGSSRRYVS